MLGYQYRIKTSALAILEKKGDKLPVTIPRNAVVRIVNGPLNGEKLVDVEWEGKTVMMFTADIQEHGELVSRDGHGH